MRRSTDQTRLDDDSALDFYNKIVSPYPPKSVTSLFESVRFGAVSGPSSLGKLMSAYDPGCVKTIFWRPRRNISSRSWPQPQ